MLNKADAIDIAIDFIEHNKLNGIVYKIHLDSLQEDIQVDLN